MTVAGAAQQSFAEAFRSSYQALLADALKDLEAEILQMGDGGVGPSGEVWGILGFQISCGVEWDFNR